MDLLRFLFAILLILPLSCATPSSKSSKTSSLEEEDPFPDFEDKRAFPEFCQSTNEYIETYEYFLKKKAVPATPQVAANFSDEVSKGCTGASARFQKILELMIKSGVEINAALALGLEFAKEDDQTQSNFYEIFKRAYLEEYFNYDFETAVKIAYEMSKHYRGPAKVAYNDFVKFSDFCVNEKELGITPQICGQYILKVVRSNHLYENGMFEDFKKLYTALREDKRFGLSIQTALDVLAQVVSHGPPATENFLSGYDFASDKKGLDLPANKALDFAVKMASRSVKEGGK